MLSSKMVSGNRMIRVCFQHGELVTLQSLHSPLIDSLSQRGETTQINRIVDSQLPHALILLTR